MKTLTTTLLGLLLLFTVSLTAQRTVAAEQIIDDLNAGKSIDLENVTIRGDLNFSALNDKEPDGRKNWGDRQNFRCHVRVPFSFVNCTFTGKVLGYYKDEKDKRNDNDYVLYNVDFHETVQFKNCTFEDKVNFKYTHFEENASFANSKFDEGAFFKYTNFESAISFEGIVVRDDCNFKYTEFDELVNFRSATFAGFANFKYIKFPDGVDFTDARFTGTADFKYAKFRKPYTLTNVDFGRKANFKYANIRP